MQSELVAELANGRLPSLLLAEEDLGAFAQFDVPKFVMASAADLTAVARNLYASLRAADQPGTQLIFARDFPPEGLGLAVRDRLRRAAVRTIGE
jgi:L-threonylcarbamoyladenylate synthase